MTNASGIGSWPGTSIREALDQVRELLDPDQGNLPYLPELPARGPGGDMVGRTTDLLVELPVDLQPAGWRLTDHPGRDSRRTAAYWREDLDQLAEVYDGYAGPLKVAVCGPWTLAANLWLPRGERAIVDPGARRDMVASLTDGITQRFKQIRALVPGVELVLQLDEPSLPSVLAGKLPTASGYGRLPSLDPQVAAAGLRDVLTAHDGPTVVHCCAPDPPLALLRTVGASALSLDTTLLTPRGWEGVAVALEDGIRLFAGLLPTSAAPATTKASAAFLDAWHRVGMPPSSLASVTATPACGLAGAAPERARAIQRAAVEVARELTEREHA